MIKDVSTMNKTAPSGILLEVQTNLADSLGSIPFWQRELTQAIRDPAILLARLGLNLPSRQHETISPSEQSSPALEPLLQSDFPLLVPESYVRRMQPGDWHDPLLKQVLPLRQELTEKSGFLVDAVDDQAAQIAPGLLQKYAGRALMITLGQCAIHCRYCFRRHFPYNEAPRSRAQWQQSLRLIQEKPEVEEIILSGGDPLILNDHRLAGLLDDLEEIPHLKRVRVHTRLPIVLPSRVTKELLDRFRVSRLQPLFVVHANHPQEIVDDCSEALTALVRGGIPVLNQAVLLKEVNDTVEVQEELCRRLINLGVIPYYLHQLDRVQGASHFETEEEIGLEIVAELKKRLPGYAVPRFVREIAGEASKTELL